MMLNPIAPLDEDPSGGELRVARFGGGYKRNETKRNEIEEACLVRFQNPSNVHEPTN